jgi:hypothetical protein
MCFWGNTREPFLGPAAKAAPFMSVEARLLGSASAIDRRNVSTVMEMS